MSSVTGSDRVCASSHLSALENYIGWVHSLNTVVVDLRPTFSNSDFYKGNGKKAKGILAKKGKIKQEHILNKKINSLCCD